MIIRQRRAALGLASAIALGMVAPAIGQGAGVSYPPSRSLPDLASWLQKETPISPAQVVDISPSAITAVVSSSSVREPRGFQATISSEAVNPDIEAHDGVASWSIPVEVNCDQRSVRLGAMTGFHSRNLRSEPKVLRQADTAFVSPTPSAPLGAVIRALCDRDFKRPLVGISTKFAAKAPAKPQPAPPGPKPEIVAALPKPPPSAPVTPPPAEPKAAAAAPAAAAASTPKPAAATPKPEATTPAPAAPVVAAAEPKPSPVRAMSNPAPAAPVVAMAAPSPGPVAALPKPGPTAATVPLRPELAPTAKPLPARAAPPVAALGSAAQPQPRPAPKRPIIPSIVIQVGASPSLPEAKGILAHVTRKFAGELDGFKSDVATVDVDGKPLYRAMISGFSSTSDARALCGKLKAGGQACFVRD